MKSTQTCTKEESPGFDWLNPEARVYADDNPNYRGAVWFANADEIGDNQLLLDAAFQVSGVHYYVAEYLEGLSDDNAIWAGDLPSLVDRAQV